MRDENLCPICNSKMRTAKSQHGCYWRCTRWGCEGTRDSMGRSKQERKESEDNNDNTDEPRWDR